MTQSVYLETSFISYLASRPSRDLVTAANQQLTHDRWDSHRFRYQLFVSDVVLIESGAGGPEAAERRLSIIKDIPTLEVNQAIEDLAYDLQVGLQLPEGGGGCSPHIVGYGQRRRLFVNLEL